MENIWRRERFCVSGPDFPSGCAHTSQLGFDQNNLCWDWSVWSLNLNHVVHRTNRLPEQAGRWELLSFTHHSSTSLRAAASSLHVFVRLNTGSTGSTGPTGPTGLLCRIQKVFVTSAGENITMYI